MNKTLIILAAAALSACAGLQQKPVVARCNEQAQWTTKNEQGQDIGIFVCFGERNQLLYVARVLPAPAPALTPEEKLEAKRASFREFVKKSDGAAK